MKHSLDKKIAGALSKKHTCYILITCDQADPDGNMQINMTYECEPILAACLLEGAQNIINEKVSAIL